VTRSKQVSRPIPPQPIPAPPTPLEELDQGEIPAPEAPPRQPALAKGRGSRARSIPGVEPDRIASVNAPDRNGARIIRDTTSLDRLRAAGVEPLLGVADWAAALGCGRRVVERMRSAGRIPPPDCHIGKMPRWYASTLREWLRAEGES
jgi:hypothetical protein